MKKWTLFFLLIFICTIISRPVRADIEKVAQTGLQFLKVDVGARPAAMGGAYMMVGDDVSAIFYNPAGVAFMQNKFDFLATRTEWIADISYNAAGLVTNLGKWGNVGVSFISSDYGDFIGTRVAPTERGFIETGMLVSCQPCTVARNSVHSLHNHLGRFGYEEIHGDTDR